MRGPRPASVRTSGGCLATQFLDNLLAGAVVAALGLFSYLVKSFFARIQTDLKALKESVDKLSGRFDAIQSEGRTTVTALAVTQQEIKAVWKFIDAAHKRASDHANGGDE